MGVESLPLFPAAARPLQLRTAPREVRAIEQPHFPFEDLSDVAELESWRKEIHRPVYHIHKWWAQRLGSVFRAIVLGTFAPAGSDIMELFYAPMRLPDVVVLDPFMGSGTTIGETLKLGGRAVGFDINPVAYFLVRNAVRMPKRSVLLDTFREIEGDVAPDIQRFYAARLPDQREAPVLYYFWVKQVDCPRCREAVDLFASYIFASHVYPERHPDARALCPMCGDINVVRYDADGVRCRSCREPFDPRSGPSRGSKATCPRCDYSFVIGKTVREGGTPPRHRLYAKLVLEPGGDKTYLPADDYDRGLYETAERMLATRKNAYPMVKIAPGYNTDQVLNYCYTYWHQMFNARQLLCLSMLADRIREISDEPVRELFCCLFSGVLEFNNMFASFKGEGTGAVRHMFSHHILKPEREPLEANPWGTPRSSGAFSTLFRSRIVRALDYCEDPFELRATRKAGRVASTKVYGLSAPLFHDAAADFAQSSGDKRVYLSCRDSARSDLPSECVDAIITDPPFFDNVHYSQLADFFHVWQRHILGVRDSHASETTRSPAEVQQSDPAVFTDRLTAVWRECYRVLKPDGLLVFTYHHSRGEGWRCMLASLLNASFAIVRAHPIKSEMSVAAPKSQAREPIDLDMIVVCRKHSSLESVQADTGELVHDAVQESVDQLRRLLAAGRRTSRNDVRAVLMAQAIARFSRLTEPTCALGAFDAAASLVEAAIDRVREELEYASRSSRSTAGRADGSTQLL